MKINKLTLLLVLYSITLSAQNSCDCPEVITEEGGNYPILLKSLCPIQLGNKVIIVDGQEILINSEDNWFNQYFHLWE